jgi:hypothetical protein
MNITECRVAGDELILKSSDLGEIRRFAYKFKAGNYEIVRKRKKRSNDANALCWAICTEIANVLRTDKDSIYVDMLKQYGQSEIWASSPDANPDEHFKYYDFFGKRMVNGKEVHFYTVYRGSSEYDTREMSILIDGIIDEAKALDIDVISEREKSLLLEEWGKGSEV